MEEEFLQNIQKDTELCRNCLLEASRQAKKGDKNKAVFLAELAIVARAHAVQQRTALLGRREQLTVKESTLCIDIETLDYDMKKAAQDLRKIGL